MGIKDQAHQERCSREETHQAGRGTTALTPLLASGRSGQTRPPTLGTAETPARCDPSCAQCFPPQHPQNRGSLP